MRKLIVGSQARLTRAVTEHELRRQYVRMHRDIYVPKGYSPDLVDVIDGAWLRSGRRGVVAGIAASALHGASWVDDDIAVELIWNNTRPPEGIIARAERLQADEMTTRQCIAVTTAARTAYDLGRHLPRLEALVRLDALKRATGFANDDVLGLATRYKGARGTRQLLELLPIVDGGAASPQETRLRLLYLDAGFPPPATQVAVFKRGWEVLRTLDMGWEEFKVASEYDGDQHRTNRVQYVRDQRLMPQVARLGWDVIRVIKEDSDAETLDRTFAALVGRGWDGQLSPKRQNHWWRPPPALGDAASL
ncbi:hypothetical protein MycrhDRAFT_1637 [Mycolicibacterium rhodesiae JS60]|nr:hypothetical protein MycrhDRAFT_1637 [Mycolicibacterium rhodesiae JS60]